MSETARLVRAARLPILEQPPLPPAVDGQWRYIYELVDPMTHQSRYVGLTNRPKNRLSEYLAYKHCRSISKNLDRWLSNLESQGSLAPIMLILEDPPVPRDEAGAAEQSWIERRRSAGCELLNVRRGGSLGSKRFIWTDEKCDQAVMKLVRKRADGKYPSYRDFRGAGLFAAYRHITRRPNGHRALADHLGLKMISDDFNDWSEDGALEAAVRQLVAKLGLDRYPTPREFYENGLAGGQTAIATRYGSHRQFAHKLGLSLMVENDWSKEENVEQAVRSLVAQLGLDHYPTSGECAANGIHNAYKAVAERYGGHVLFAQKLALPIITRSWSDEEHLKETVMELIAQLEIERYPTAKEFYEADLRGAYNAIRKMPGKHPAFARSLGVSIEHRVKWSRQELKDVAKDLIEDLGLDRYPTKIEFKAAGLYGAYATIRREWNGHPNLAQELGLPIKKTGGQKAAISKR